MIEWALAAVIMVGFPAMAGACFWLVWRISELHDNRLREIDEAHDRQIESLIKTHDERMANVMDRIQAPEAAHVAAYEQFVPHRPDRELSDATFPPVELDEDFRLAEILEES